MSTEPSLGLANPPPKKASRRSNTQRAGRIRVSPRAHPDRRVVDLRPTSNRNLRAGPSAHPHSTKNAPPGNTIAGEVEPRRGWPNRGDRDEYPVQRSTRCSGARWSRQALRAKVLTAPTAGRTQKSQRSSSRRPAPKRQRPCKYERFHPQGRTLRPSIAALLRLRTTENAHRINTSAHSVN